MNSVIAENCEKYPLLCRVGTTVGVESIFVASTVAAAAVTAAAVTAAAVTAATVTATTDVVTTGNAAVIVVVPAAMSARSESR